jgi:ring-1,2-phenylacetyl-CoA epoxidase subunit PaaB
VKVYEVFLRKEGKEEFRHAGSLEAPDDELATLLARESYVRRAEGDEMWLVDRASIVVVDPELIAPNADKPHRHNDGSRIASWRKTHRES